MNKNRRNLLRALTVGSGAAGLLQNPGVDGGDTGNDGVIEIAW